MIDYEARMAERLARLEQEFRAASDKYFGLGSGSPSAEREAARIAYVNAQQEWRALSRHLSLYRQDSFLYALGKGESAD